MKLQLALDMLDVDGALKVIEHTFEYIDIVELGTPLIKCVGLKTLIPIIKENFPDKLILADLKTMDVGRYESDMAFDLGADIVTVLGTADLATIQGAKYSAVSHNKQVLVDMIAVKNILELTKKIESIAVDFIGIHSGIDQQQQGMTPLKALQSVRKIAHIPVAVAGGITLETIDSIIAENPATIIVGGAITSSKSPEVVAKQMWERIQIG
ncbi:MAG: 3-hexulose-6-phosphate synthase [Gammaproteobacteria bacterium]|nr:MAG: 3-hexulose-6-phosphate synthase [Gammaproteobacteria bacterium]